MSIAFIGVHRLVNKMVNTCTKFCENGSYSNVYFPQSSGFRPVAHPSAWPVTAVQIGSTPQVSPGSYEPIPTIPLRVMRLAEKQSSPLNAGRMVISGRFEDVCAELDRLTERQNQQISLRK